MSEILVTINGTPYSAKQGETLLETAERNGIEIPTLCHDPRLMPYSSCFVCVVEIEGARGLQTACSTKSAEGMVVQTNNTRVRKSRKTALDLLLSNHYADCVAPCKEACPAGVDVQGYISLIEKQMYSEAVALIKEVNPLPAICGRVCVRPCEAACNRNYMDEGTAVGIDYMKRFASDYDLNSDNHYKPEVLPPTGKKVAIIGAGPGGLSAAYFLQQKGHQCDIFEANNHAGGWLRYGIPEYRLPNDLLDQEIATITELGTNIFLNKNLGKNLSYEKIAKEYNSTILTIGSQKGTLLRAEGEEADGVFSGIDFLRNMEQTGQKYNFKGKTIVVVGGGNTAMDCCRTSIRCNADKVYVVYRRTEKEMPANPIEIHESKLENVEYLFLTNPTKVNANAQGKVESMTCIKMELGQPDASGRRRPMPIEGSEYDLKVDYILAAIGQKTDVNFINDINQFSPKGELKINRWGDIDADATTLQTGIPSVFAAGDGVSGPATIIEAIAQAGTAARSCHQFLTGKKIEPKPTEFLSKKGNFKTFTTNDFQHNFAKQMRKEMPVLATAKRMNFNEVELGYTEEETLEETARCFECGCTEVFRCDLKDYSTEYGVEQAKFSGGFQEFKVDFSHPYIEIDNNKCILCSRCIRICDEVVGANALGLAERGFDTYVVPSMGKSLTETPCESCGMCISTCPTGAITENLSFKPGPVELAQFETINNYGSSGERITVNHRANFVMKMTGASGIINPLGSISREAKFGYRYLNLASRITTPLLKSADGGFEEISYEKAFEIITEKIKSAKPNANAFFAGAVLSNQEQYLVKKLATINSASAGSFHYLGREGYAFNSFKNTPFDEIKQAKKVWLFGADISQTDGFVSYLVNNAKAINGTQIHTITTSENKSARKADTNLKIKSYYWFSKAANKYILEKDLQNQPFIHSNTENFASYAEEISGESLSQMAKKAGASTEQIANFVEQFNTENNAILIFSEKEISGNTSKELFNLAAITGKLGKTASGLISLKEKNNSHGLFDNNLVPSQQFAQDFDTGTFKNLFIFGEDPVGTAIAASAFAEKIKPANFIMVLDTFLSKTAQMADLIIPASFSVESEGSFTNTQRVLQTFQAGLTPEVDFLTHEVLLKLLANSGSENLQTLDDIFLEAASKLPQYPKKLTFKFTNSDNHNRQFNFGACFMDMNFKQEFEANFLN